MPIETVTVVPEDIPPWSKLLNPIWWLQNGGTNATWTAPLINNGTPYLPDVSNQLLRDIYWWFRNPFGNFVGFIIGFEGTTFTATGPAPVLANTWRDVPGGMKGWKWSLINKWAPFVSYWGGKIEFYAGWRPSSGGFGAKFVIRSNG
jgi:hypothetical protein